MMTDTQLIDDSDLAVTESQDQTVDISDLVGIATNPIPTDARTGTFETKDGATLRYAHWLPSHGRHRGTICLCQGRGEFIEKYFETISQLRARGFAVASFDWRGQGGSERTKPGFTGGHIDHFDQYVQDLRDFHRTILLPDCRGPYFLLAHSMGALAGLLAIAQDRLMFERVMLFAPMLGLPMNGMQKIMGTKLAAFLRYSGFKRMLVGGRQDGPPKAEGFAGNRLTSDFSRYIRMVNVLQKAPELGVGRPTVAWVHAAFKAMEQVRGHQFAAKLKVPIMVLTAGADLIVSNRATESSLVHWRGAKHVCVANARHELLMENEAVQAQIYAAIDAFITDSTGI